MNIKTDTIAAVSTAPGEAGIAIVRVSGPDSIEIVDTVFRSKSPLTEADGNSLHYGHVLAGHGEKKLDVDEVVTVVFRAPKSYTREDVVEIQGHGGRTAAARILRALIAAGARQAEPGEFTRRAFLNGRIDLLQAEAVCDLIMARTDRAATAAIEQLEGRLSDSFSTAYKNLLEVASDIEATLDFEEGELPEAAFSDMAKRVMAEKDRMDELLATWEEGHLLRDGALVVISGRTNAGKSSLMNRLLGNDRAIVTEIPGTTRDFIEEGLVLDGVSIRLVDTAGFRLSDCKVEREGVSRAEDLMQKADLVLYIVDASLPPETQDLENTAALGAAGCLVVLNKKDLGVETRESHFKGLNAISCSLLDEKDCGSLLSAMSSMLASAVTGPPHAVIAERHRTIVQFVLSKLNVAHDLLDAERDEQTVLAAAEIRQALERLGTVTGSVYTSDLLDSVFSRFCVGK